MPKVTLKRAISFGHGINQKTFQAGDHVFGLEEMSHWAIPGLKLSGDLIVHPEEEIAKKKANPVHKVIFVSNGEQVQVPLEEAKNIVPSVPVLAEPEKAPEKVEEEAPDKVDTAEQNEQSKPVETKIVKTEKAPETGKKRKRA
jgi:hypothetical protein